MAMDTDLMSLKWWFTQNHMVLSTEKTKYINFSLRKSLKDEDLVIYKCIKCLCQQTKCNDFCALVGEAVEIKYLGLTLDSELNWRKHVFNLKNKLNNVLRIFYFLRELCNEDILKRLYFSLVQSRLEYGLTCWGGTYKSNINSLLLQQKHFVRLILRKVKTETSKPLFFSLKIFPLEYLYVYKVLKYFYSKSGNRNFFGTSYRTKLRTGNNFPVPKPVNTFFTKSFIFMAPRMYNLIPDYIKSSFNSTVFSKRLQKWLFTQTNINFLTTIQV